MYESSLWVALERARQAGKGFRAQFPHLLKGENSFALDSNDAWAKIVLAFAAALQPENAQFQVVSLSTKKDHVKTVVVLLQRPDGRMLLRHRFVPFMANPEIPGLSGKVKKTVDGGFFEDYLTTAVSIVDEQVGLKISPDRFTILDLEDSEYFRYYTVKLSQGEAEKTVGTVDVNESFEWLTRSLQKK